jgi:NADH-quinone oxidoreductase subunit J
MTLELIASTPSPRPGAGRGAAVISVRNPVHAALFLVLTFFTSACTWMLPEAEFLGVALVLVYVGAVMVLFLFVVMMLDINTARRCARASPLPAGRPAGGGGDGCGDAGADRRQRFEQDYRSRRPRRPPAACSNTEWLGRRLFTEYLYPFEIAAVILPWRSSPRSR